MKREGDHRSWWRGSAEIFCSCFRFHRRNPSVKPAACQLPFQGSLFCLVNSHQQNSPGGAYRRLARRNITLFTLEIGGEGQRRPAAFFAEKKKRSKKRKEFAFHLYYTAKYHPKIPQETVTIDSHQQNSPGGAYRRLVRRNITFFTLEIGGVRSAATRRNPPEGHTGGCCRRNTTLFTLEIGGQGQRRLAAIPRRGEQAAAAAVTLPFSQLKLGGKVSGDSPPVNHY